MTAEVARLREAEAGWTVTETSEGVFRRVVSSPAPREVLESAQIAALVGSGSVVIAGGGGGIPVVPTGTGWTSVDAVIDKDRLSALLAARIGVQTLVLVTGVEQVYVGFGTPDQRALSSIDPSEARAHLAAGEFPAGSMGPKVESALAFLADGGKQAVITSISAVSAALAGTGGTHITDAPTPADAGPDQTT
jgi:carbamate kinase